MIAFLLQVIVRTMTICQVMMNFYGGSTRCNFTKGLKQPFCEVINLHDISVTHFSLVALNFVFELDTHTRQLYHFEPPEALIF